MTLDFFLDKPLKGSLLDIVTKMLIKQSLNEVVVGTGRWGVPGTEEVGRCFGGPLVSQIFFVVSTKTTLGYSVWIR